jgi:soluble lytic murein transglycosylase
MRAGGSPASKLLALIATGLAFAASAAVRGPESDAVDALRRVRQALDAGDLERVLKRLARLDSSPLADHAALLRARAQHQLGRKDDAIAAAEAGLRLDPPRELEFLLLQEIARIEIGRGRLLEAYKAGQRAWESTGDAERAAALAHELARAFDANGLPGDALQLYRRVWSDWPLAEVAEPAFERSEQLTQGTGAPAAPVYSLLQRANRLREAFRCAAALPLYERAVLRAAELDASAQRGAREGRARCLFDTRRYAEAAEAFAQLAKDRKDPESVDFGVLSARAWSRTGDESRALADLAALRKRASPEDRAEIDFWSALTLRTVQPARYRELLVQVERQTAVDSLASDARWRLAWDDFVAGEHAKALERMTPMSQGNALDVEVQRARYWVALGSRESDAERSQHLLRELAETQPLSYYGMLAGGQLEAASRPELSRSLLGPRPAEPIHARAARAGWLIDAGFPELARAELASWLAAERLGRSQRLQAAALLHEIGEHYRAVQTVSDGFAGVLEQGIDPEWREAWELAWPRPFEPQVHSAVAEFGFDPTLVWAVMREESTYRPAVESPAGAIGLMQIIPPTGQRIAEQLGFAGFGPENLRLPELNIRFGTYYLKDLVERFEGSQPLAIAAYNAGPEAVTRWVDDGGLRSDDVFVESVPYGETRRYLRRVLRSQRIYRLLYTPEPPSR